MPPAVISAPKRHTLDKRAHFVESNKGPSPPKHRKPLPRGGNTAGGRKERATRGRAPTDAPHMSASGRSLRFGFRTR